MLLPPNRGCYEGINIGTLKPALKIGEKLIESKRVVKHALQQNWMTWCGKNLKTARRTVTNYMRLFKIGRLQGVNSLTEAYERIVETGKSTKTAAPKLMFLDMTPLAAGHTGRLLRLFTRKEEGKAM